MQPGDTILVMSTISQIAARDRVSKAAVSKAVKKMFEKMPETPVERGSQGQVVRVSLAHYDHFRDRFMSITGLPAGQQALSPRSAGSQVDPSESFNEARRQNEWLKLERERLKHQVESGLLIDKAKVEGETKSMRREIQARINRLPNIADGLALAISREGVFGARHFLSDHAAKLSAEIWTILTGDIVSGPAIATSNLGALLEAEEPGR
ncbi:hypothetical protein [Rhizobium leguminosarum]|uniref:hypothetical protein n=1 Tax=Rhizobium leguminosarum TaxID=384 RepID=UPI0004222797|nr:hypothetical protein [Rhizobium leguminosarum]